MKPSCVVLALLLPMEAAAVTVSLTTGQYQVVGSPITLRATVTATPPPPLPRLLKPSPRTLTETKPTYSYTYTYTAQRTSPCQETIAIAGSGPSTTWTPAANKAGSYTLKVAVVEKMRTAVGAESDATAAATTPLTLIRSGSPVAVTLGGSGQTVTITAKVPPPSGGTYRYHFLARAVPGGTEGQYTNAVTVGGFDGNQPSFTGSFSWTRGASVHVEVIVDAISQTDCTLVSSVGSADHNVQ